jgi:hypothetical protein
MCTRSGPRVATPLCHHGKGIYGTYVYMCCKAHFFPLLISCHRVQIPYITYKLACHTFAPNAYHQQPNCSQQCHRKQQSAARTYDHSQVFLRGTEHGFGLRTGTCCSALDPTHAALHARHFGKIAESLNGEHNITNDEDFTNRVETICKTHHVKYPNISINPTVFGTGKESEFSVRLDACDSKNDFLLEIEMRIKNPEGLSAAKLMAKDD